MRANPEAHQYRAAQLIHGMSQLPQGSAVLGNPHGNGSALPHKLQLPRPRTFYRKIDRVGVIGLGVAELNRGCAVAVDGQVDEWRIGVETLAEHDDGLSVPHSVREEFRRRGDGEVTGHFSPNVVELIRLGPDVGAGTSDLVLPGGGVNLRGRRGEEGRPRRRNW